MLKLSAFRSRDFRIYIAGNAFSLQAMWIHRITIGWLAWDLSGSASYVGWVAFLGFAPTLITGPLFGVIVDRVPIRRAAMQSQGALFGLYLLTAVLFGTGQLTLLLLPFLALGIGIISSAHHPVRMSLAPLLVPHGDIPSLVNATALNFNMARTIGPAIGGLLISSYGVGPTLWVVVSCSLPYQIALRYLHPRDRESDGQAASRTIFAGLATGFRYAWRTRYIRDILATTGLFALLGRGMQEVLPLIADGIFQRGAAGLGALTSSLGSGALLASGLMAFVGPPASGKLPVAGQIAALGAVTMALIMALSPLWPVTLLAAALLGFGGTVVGISMQSAMQTALPDDFRGRVMSLWVMTGIGGSAIGALLIGALADLTGLGTAALSLGLLVYAGLILLPRLLR